MHHRIPLNHGLFAIVDADDVGRVQKHRWIAARKDGRWYAQMTEKPVPLHHRFMHRFIMRPPVGMVIDHINGDELDNRKRNLRIVTQAENAANRPDRAGGRASQRIAKKARNGARSAIQIEADIAAEHERFSQYLAASRGNEKLPHINGMDLQAATNAYHKRLRMLESLKKSA